MRFVKESVIRATPERVFAFHELPDAIKRLLPLWENARIVEPAQISRVGSRAVIDTRVFGLFTVRWVAEHTVYDPPRMFEDVQIKGPFHRWRHRHIVRPHASGAVLCDDIEYQPPLGFLGHIGAPLVVVPRLQKLFNYRHEVTRRWCEANEQG